MTKLHEQLLGDGVVDRLLELLAAGDDGIARGATKAQLHIT